MNARIIAEIVCREFGVSPTELVSQRRQRYVCKARFAFYWLCRELTVLSLPQIGRSIGLRDHTTVMHGLERINDFPDVLLKARNIYGILKWAKENEAVA